MTKFKTTTKFLRQNYDTILSVGYCDMSHLLRYTSPIAYNCGVYGWNYDAYEVDNILICTGYRGMPACRNINNDFELIRDYEKKAQAIVENWNCWSNKQNDVNGLLNELLNKLMEA